MQGEVRNGVFNLAINTSKLAIRTLAKAFQICLGHRREQKLRRGTRSNIEKKSVANLLKDSKKLTDMEISETSIAEFEKHTKKYRIGYGIKIDDSVTSPKYLVFSKTDDGGDMAKAFRAYLASVMQREKKPSVLKQSSKFKKRVRAMPKRIRNKDKEHSL